MLLQKQMMTHLQYHALWVHQIVHLLSILSTHTHHTPYTHNVYRIHRLSALQLSFHEQIRSLEQQQSRERVSIQHSLKKEMQHMQRKLLGDSVRSDICWAISQLCIRAGRVSIPYISLSSTAWSLSAAKTGDGSPEAFSAHHAHEDL